MESVHAHIQNYYGNLSSTEQLAIDFILQYDDLDNLKLKIIQEALHVSAPTIIRAVKKLDFRSFTEFKYALISSVQIPQKGKAETSFESVVNLIKNDFNQTMEMMNKEKVLAIASAILKSRRIICAGIGSSASVANSFNRKLKNFGLWSNNYAEVFPIRDLPDIVQKEDCIIVFSLSGAEEQIIDLVTACKLKGCKLIAVTGFSTNPLTNLSDISLMTHQSTQNRKKLRSRLMLTVASEVIFETVLLIQNTEKT